MIERWLRLPAYREELRAAGIGRDEDSIRTATHSLIAAMQPRAARTFDAFLDLVGRPARRIVLPSGHTTP
jgi:GMP synthase (glutamine-hydrolysing)